MKLARYLALIVLLFAAFCMGIGALIGRATAQDGAHGRGHAENHDAYRLLSNPTTGGSCCNGTVAGVEGDCRPGAVWRDGGGDLRARIGGRELFVPESALVPGTMNPHPPVGMICERGGKFFCVALSGAGG